MLQSIRDNLKGAVAVVIVIIMVVPLMLFGLDALFVNPGAQSDVASVDGEEITENELQRAVFMRKNQLLSQFGDNLPASMISDESLREPVLDMLIKRKALELAAREGGLTAAPTRVNELILSVPDFKVDGKFNQNMYQQLVNRMGYTAIGYRDQLAEDILLNQQVSGISSSGFITEQELARITALSQQKRDFYYLTVPLAPIQASIEISDEDAQAYYEENKNTFMNPEQVSIEYLELSLANLESGIEIPEQELRAQYEQEAAAYVANTERRAAHILIESNDPEAIADVQKRLEAGEEFAAVAEALSDDFGSKEDGGDLGFTSGETFPEEFETALAALDVGAVSAPVQTDAGTHIIKLLDERGAEPPSFEDDRGRIEQALKQARAEKEFLDLKQEFEDLTYNVNELTSAAEQLGLELKQVGPFSRSGGFGISSEPVVIEAAFSDELVDTGVTSLTLELNPTQLVVVRVTDHQEPRVLDFAEVKNTIVRQLKREHAVKQVEQTGQELVAKIQAGESVEDVAIANNYEWQVSADTLRTDAKVKRDILGPVFAMSKPEGTPIVKGMTLDSGDYVVVSLTEVVDGDVSALSAAEKANLSARLASLWGETSYVAYEELAEQLADIERY